jgi:hypothetical protein
MPKKQKLPVGISVPSEVDVHSELEKLRNENRYVTELLMSKWSESGMGPKPRIGKRRKRDPNAPKKPPTPKQLIQHNNFRARVSHAKTLRGQYTGEGKLRWQDAMKMSFAGSKKPKKNEEVVADISIPELTAY